MSASPGQVPGPNQASGRAVVVGEATGGGGHFGGFARLPGGFEMFLPRGRTYDFRTGKDWDGKGVQPDIAVPYDRAIDAALDAIATRSPSVAAQGAVRRPIDPPERTVLNGRTVTIPLTEDGGFYFVDAMIGDQRVRLTIETGANFFSIGQRAAASIMKRPPCSPPP